MSSHIFWRLETAVADVAVVGVDVGFLMPAGGVSEGDLQEREELTCIRGDDGRFGYNFGRGRLSERVVLLTIVLGLVKSLSPWIA